jgi:4-aminobutyrate aminotransferase/(S)-3-amino-2-methylpropionate transaminase
VAKSEIADASPPGSETGTYAGNILSCAAGLASIAVYEDENLAGRAERLGAYFLDRLGELAERHPVVGEVRGRGLMVAAELVSDRQTREPLPIAREASMLAVKKGLFLYPGGHYKNVLAFMPPLVTDEAQIDAAVEIVDEVLLELSGKVREVR